MSFIRKSKRNGKIYLSEVENKWIDGKCVQKHIRYIGTEVDGTTKLASSISDIEVEEVKVFGPLIVLHHIAEELALPDLLGKYSSELLSLIYAHCLNYKSINSMSSWFKRTDLAMLLDIENVTEKTLLNALDSLDDIDVDYLQMELFNTLNTKFKVARKGLVYDVTNTYFYGKHCPLGKMGHDKEGVKGRPLIQIALAVTQEKGLPLFHKVFDGNIHDARTLQDVAITMKQYRIKAGLIIYDRGVVSAQNIDDFLALFTDSSNSPVNPSSSNQNNNNLSSLAGRLGKATMNLAMGALNAAVPVAEASTDSSSSNTEQQTQRERFSLPSVLPKSHSNSTLNYLYASGRGIERGRDEVVDSLLHPIETTKNMGIAVWDGYNAAGDLMLGLSTEGSRIRNAARGNAVNNGITEFINADGPRRTEMLSEIATVGILGAATGGLTRGLVAEGMEAKGLAIKTSYGHAFQRLTPQGFQAKDLVQNGIPLYRAGKTGASQPQGRYWALERPSNSNYAANYGIPQKNTPFDFVQEGQLNPGAAVIVREAPAIGANQGGHLEAVVERNGVSLGNFSEISENILRNQLTGNRSQIKQIVDSVINKAASEPILGALISEERNVSKPPKQ